MPQPSESAARQDRHVAVVIDDRPDVRYIVGKRLRAMGFEVHEAADGRGGLALARRHRPEVILVDIVLPDIDGYQVARELRRELGRSVRMAAMTGFGTTYSAECLEAGFDQIFPSPVEPAALESWLGRSSA